MRKKNYKKEMTSKYVAFTRHFDTPDEIAAKSLSDYTVSSTVTYGPEASLLKFLLESLNKACLNDQPDTVARLTASILKNRLTEFMEISKMEIILAHTRAVTILNPGLPIKDYYEYLIQKYYNCHIIN